MDRSSFEPELLPDDLWTSARWVTGRSPLGSALSITRFRGPRRGRRDGAAHDFWEMTGVLGGEGVLWVQGGEIPMARGDVLLIPPGVGHDEFSQDPALETIWVAFRAPSLVPRGLPGPRSSAVAADAVLRAGSESLLTEIEQLWLLAGRRHGALGPELDGRLLAIVGRFLRGLAETESRQDLDGVDRAIQLLREQFRETLPVGKLAELAGCSLGHFQRAFKRHTGRTVVAFRREIRLQQATHLLRHTALPVSEVAEQCGFPDPFYFSRSFQSYAGMSPRAFRRKAGRGEEAER